MKHPPKSLETMSALFPLVWALGLGALVYALMSAPSWSLAGGLVAWIYLPAPLLYRLIAWKWPIPEGSFFIGKLSSHGHTWMISFALQRPYMTLPVLEKILLLIHPGLFNSWLRLWGSRIGRGVSFSPSAEVVDRTMLEVGDFTILGHRVSLSNHVVVRRRGRLKVYCKRTVIGAKVIVPYESMLGPGTVIPDHATVPPRTILSQSRRLSERTGDESLAN